jgi:glycerophosphoryl diester phosphodiesterase
MMNSTPPFTRPLVHGHRGCRGLRPENTLPAFLHALALGVDVLELDVVISADNQVVVSHEPWLAANICLDAQGQRIPPVLEQHYNLYHLPYDVIRQCDCGQLQHPDFPEQLALATHKPLLREVLATVAAATQQLGRPLVRYSVEVKSTPAEEGRFHPAPPQFLRLVLAELQASHVLARTTLLCFDARILQLAHEWVPALDTCLLYEEAEPWSASLASLGFVPTAFGPDYHTVTPAAIHEFRAVFPSVQLVPWTVNEPADMLRLMAGGIDGITTDYPDRLLLLLA